MAAFCTAVCTETSGYTFFFFCLCTAICSSRILFVSVLKFDVQIFVSFRICFCSFRISLLFGITKIITVFSFLQLFVFVLQTKFDSYKNYYSFFVSAAFSFLFCIRNLTQTLKFDSNI